MATKKTAAKKTAAQKSEEPQETEEASSEDRPVIRTVGDWLRHRAAQRKQ